MPRRSRDEMFTQLSAVWQSFRDDAAWENTEDGEQLVWRGFVTKLFEEHKLAGPSYVRVRDELVRMEAITPKFQGTGQQKSVFYISEDAPTRDQWDSLRDLGAYSLRGLTRLKPAIQLAELATKVKRLEENLISLASDYNKHKKECPHNE